MERFQVYQFKLSRVVEWTGNYNFEQGKKKLVLSRLKKVY